MVENFSSQFNKLYLSDYLTSDRTPKSRHPVYAKPRGSLFRSRIGRDGGYDSMKPRPFPHSFSEACRAANIFSDELTKRIACLIVSFFSNRRHRGVEDASRWVSMSILSGHSSLRHSERYYRATKPLPRLAFSLISTPAKGLNISDDRSRSDGMCWKTVEEYVQNLFRRRESICDFILHVRFPSVFISAKRIRVYCLGYSSPAGAG